MKLIIVNIHSHGFYFAPVSVNCISNAYTTSPMACRNGNLGSYFWVL